jgi:hypothetical protein
MPKRLEMILAYLIAIPLLVITWLYLKISGWKNAG